MRLAILITVFFTFGWPGANPPFDQPVRPKFEGLNFVQDPSLREAIVKYYDNESSKNWIRTYEMRSPTFRKTVPYNLYKRTMEDDARGWALVSITVESASRTFDENIGENTVLVDIYFVDKILNASEINKKNWRQSYRNGNLYRMLEHTVWVQASEQWSCLDCGRRRYLSLNIRLTVK